MIIILYVEKTQKYRHVFKICRFDRHVYKWSS